MPARGNQERVTAGQGWRSCLGVLCLMVVLGACTKNGPYVWVTNLPAEQTSARAADYYISPGDVIGVRVYNQEALSTHGRTRSDGKIAVPLLGEVEVQGKRPSDLAKELEVAFKRFIVEPSVTVVVEEIQPLSISVLGEVAHPGPFTLDRTAGVLQALASAGGPNEFASRDRIFVLRKSRVGGQQEMLRIRFTYDLLIHNDPQAVGFTLKTGDVVVVE